MKTRQGNLITLGLNGEFDVIVHGCNCFNVMGAGIAKQIKATFPSAFRVDSYTKRGDATKLGTYTSTEVDGLTIVNAYTQFHYGQDAHVSYCAIFQVFQLIAQDFKGKRIGIPMIGAGLGRGNWDYIKEVIEGETFGLDITLVQYKEP